MAIYIDGKKFDSKKAESEMYVPPVGKFNALGFTHDSSKLDMLNKLSHGATVSELAESGGDSTNTIQSSLAYMRGKIGAANTTELISRYIRAGVLK